MSLTFEQRQQLRQRRSELVKARCKRESRSFPGGRPSRAECGGCGAETDAFSVTCPVCQHRLYKRRQRGLVSEPVYEAYMAERATLFAENMAASRLGLEFTPIGRRLVRSHGRRVDR